MLILWQPLSLGFVGSSALNSLSVRGLPLALVLLGRVAVAAVGVAAGLALWRRRPGAVTLARASLLLSAAADVFVYSHAVFSEQSTARRFDADSRGVAAVVRHLADVSLALQRVREDVLRVI